MSSLFQQSIPDNPFLQRKKKNWLDYSDDPSSASDPANIQVEPSDIESANQDPTFDEIYRSMANVESGPKAKAYADYVAKVPTREMNQPGKMDKLAAILGGASEGYFGGAGRGIGLARNILDNKYNEAIQSYKLQEPGMRAAASQEESDFGRKVSLAKNIESGLKAKRDQAEKKRLDDSQILRRSVQNYKDMNPDAKFETIDGKVVATSGPVGNVKTQVLGDAGVLSSTAMGQKKELEAFNQNAIGQREVGVAGAVAPITRKTQELNQENIGKREVGVAEKTQPLKVDLENIRAGNRVTLKTTPTEGNKNQTPAAERTRLRVNANDVISQHPELAKYIKVGDGKNGLATGDVQISMPGMFSDPIDYQNSSKEEFNKAYDLVHAGTSKAQDSKTGPVKGTKKTFPNGKIGIWDGTGWVAQ